LTSDINLDGVWTPIGDNSTGDASTRFTGKFYGKGHSIKNLKLPSDKLYTGLFGYTDNALIEYLSVELAPGVVTFTETGSHFIGVIAGKADNNTDFNNIHVSGGDLSITGGSHYIIGGIAGQASGGSIRNSSVEININASNGTNISAGGIAGFCDGGVVTEIENCYTAGDVSAATTTSDHTIAHAGGIMGINQGAIKNCYAAGNVSTTAASASFAAAYAGGIAGYNDGTIKYSAVLSHSVKASASDNVFAGRVCVSSSGTLIDNIAYSDMILTENNSPASITDDANGINGEGKNDAALKTQTTYTDLFWDFSAVWAMGPASYPYPILKW
jgi:hypothetical protein